jgi:peptidoglycan/xylan/chitin deacetylase (PgdA/CDA1 family)
MSRLLACSLALVLTPAAGFAGAPAAMRVALVFDDGPDPQQTPRLLRALAEAEAVATFPYLGRQVEAHPQLARAAAAAGHEIANHSFSHPHLRRLPDAEVKAELSRTSLAVEWATGRPPAWFWAPFLETDARIGRLARAAAGLEHFPLDRVRLLSTEDWNTARTDAAAILRNATTGVEDLTIILFHEWRAETADQLPAILAELRRQGCEFLTLTGLATALAAASAP